MWDPWIVWKNWVMKIKVMLPNECDKMSDEWWVMSDGNWVTEIEWWKKLTQTGSLYLLASFFSLCFLANQTGNESIYNFKGSECDDWLSIFLSFLMFYLIGLNLKLSWAMINVPGLAQLCPDLKWILLDHTIP